MREMGMKRQVNVGGVLIGGEAPVSIQSMTNTDTRDVNSTVSQILRLEEAGCEIIRSAVPDMEAAQAIKKIKEQIHIPLVADIHFDYRLALECMKNGIDKIRINPGNIGSRERTKQVVEMAKDMGIPIRIGVNGGSLEKELLEKYKRPTADALLIKWAENLNRHFSKEDTDRQQAHEKMLNITNYQRNAYKSSNKVLPHTNKNGHHPSLKTLQLTNPGEDVEKWEPSYTVSGNVSWCSYCVKQYTGSSES